MDINEYTNGLLLSFLDEFHKYIREILSQKHGDHWFERGVAKHVGQQYIDRTRQMLESPMHAVDMGKAESELYGVEHLANIVDGNWDAFCTAFDDRPKVKVYLGEITEVRHNLAHRRKHHVLRRRDMVRFVSNCCFLLRVISPNLHTDFDQLLNQLLAGGAPWGVPLAGRLPPTDTVVTEFIGRSAHLDELFAWLSSDNERCLVWGDGGAGKSAIAYEFAKRVQEGNAGGLLAVCWISAKSAHFVEGSVQQLEPDFHDADSAARALCNALYSTEVDVTTYHRDNILRELKDLPCLVVVDDLDTVLNDEDTAAFLTYELPRTKARVLFTSRQRVPGLRTVEVKGLDGSEFEDFLANRAARFKQNEKELLAAANSIHGITKGYPLYVEDLLRLALVMGLDKAIQGWSARKGDAAREYALRRQLERLPEAARDVLIAIAASRRSLTALELASLTGCSDDDILVALNGLLNWCLVGRILGAGGSPAFESNRNTARLVQKTFGHGNAWKIIEAALRAQTPDFRSKAKSTAVGSLIAQAFSLVLRADYEGACQVLNDGRTGDLENEPDLISAIGWVYTRSVPPRGEDARKHFELADRLGSRKLDTYRHWVELERNLAEESEKADAGAPEAWIKVLTAAEKGLERIGQHQALLYYGGLARRRMARQLEKGYLFDRSRAEYAKAASYCKRALTCEPDPNWPVSGRAIHGVLVHALEGVEEPDELGSALRNWRHEFPDDPYVYAESRRLKQRFPRMSI